MRRGIRSFWRLVAVCAFILAISLASSGTVSWIAGPAPAGATQANDDTSGGGTIVILFQFLRSHCPLKIIAPNNKSRKGGFTLVIPCPFAHPPTSGPFKGFPTINFGDIVRIALDPSGQFTLRVSTKDGGLLSGWYAPISVKPPRGAGHWVLEVQTKAGWAAVPHDLVYGPGVFRWVLVSGPSPHPTNH